MILLLRPAAKYAENHGALFHRKYVFAPSIIVIFSEKRYFFLRRLLSVHCVTCDKAWHVQQLTSYRQVNGTVSLTGPGSYGGLKVIYGDLNIHFSSATPDGMLALDSLLFVSGSISITATQNARLGVKGHDIFHSTCSLLSLPCLSL